ncbi:hypothetical protein COW36_10495 [bacterium (Candidatus Blackallbacteria) CG17_big_fil_post_rev_8_21_14_2_50_48_46]|uniref:Uncharacterized protein n=1 Tax=bacterium (Candidatus Blackallbacteria) CG17_big_fil_post_rev_8_21_14_2_50_48_46 TaxID=2014261 RepID=A0A2M7G524_9BACT|nr:MAG: hypothetical protein COW64_20270 [bacterium (Candidatus Blackallbacteria) CG18_big_fil_WC_8_21_14_2_50_49_26]PIW17059.1 MAG: hypothetical protein COW36_10495 [bacterium (Candidatus Blackallbacteria) CG17_big_fil_post_rev_8_21_14_2_50_48_46]PIW47706.1 MAG: hypothetical protein COW20_11725 [bacterium (Candidatus Blackallbacteria) CG13_big_fil_rev_8_21_14_2_50_49_14]
MELQPLRQMMTQALQNDQKINAAEFAPIKAEILKDQKISPEENQMLMDALTQGQFEGSLVPAVISFVSQGLQTPAQPAAPAAEAPKPEAVKTPEAEKKASPWKKEYSIQGNLNHTSVSSGWTNQYGSEKTATKVEGSFQAQVDYEEGRTSWKNRILLEYGNTFVKGEQERAISRNNLEVTTEAAHKIGEQGNLKVEIPYVSLYTKGPLTEIEGRKFRETTGAKVTYTTDDKQGEYSVKVGAGIQQTNDPATRQWNNEVGVEMVVEAKQSMGFMKAPIVKATGIKEENVTFLDRLEGTAQVNAFNPMQNGADWANTDVGVRLSGRYYVNDKKSIWVGATQQYQYGGKADSTWEQKFSADLGFKFQ